MLLKKDPSICVQCGVVLHIFLWCMGILALFQRTLKSTKSGVVSKYVHSLGWITVEPWPVFIGEKCAACGGMANMRGSEAHTERQGTK